MNEENKCQKHPEGGLRHEYIYCHCDISAKDTALERLTRERDELEAKLAPHEGNEGVPNFNNRSGRFQGKRQECGIHRPPKPKPVGGEEGRHGGR